VRARVSMPVMAGILFSLSHFERDFLASQWLKFSEYSLTMRPLICMRSLSKRFSI